MLVIQSADGQERLIAHMHREDVKTLEVIKQRFNGETALWDCRGKEWVAIQDLELSTAKEVDTT